MVRCIHIAPELPPTVGGVADYTAILTRRLVEVSDGAVEPVLVHAGRQQADAVEVDFPVVDLSGQQSAQRLAAAVQDLAQEAEQETVVLLEYSGYGYAKRGAPLWLARSLSRVCGEDGVPLVTMIHEVRASSWKPWTSTFWLSAVQGYVVARLARTSRAIVTNRHPSAEWIRSWVRNGTPVRVQPVFSNVGEPDFHSPSEERESYAVVFGGAMMKTRLYETIDKSDGLLEGVGVDRIVDLGRSENTPCSVGGLPVEPHGIQPASAISTHLRRATVGLLQYPVDYLTKSGIWASYAAHGLPTVIISEASETDALNEGKHFIRWNCEGELSRGSCFADVGQAVWDWYQSEAHSSEAARTFRSVLQAIISGPLRSQATDENSVDHRR